MRYPERLLMDDEQVVEQFRPHWKVLLPALGWAMVIAALVGVGFAALDPPAERWVLLAGVLVWLVVAGRSVLDYWFTNYVLTSDRIIVRRGMIARSGTQIPLEQVSNVLFSQSVIERLLRYGDVVFESAGSQGQSELHDIPDPEGFKSQVARVREARSLAMRQGPGPAGHASGDVVSQLERLADLRERGHLSDEEFEAKKRRLLDGADPADPADPDLDV